MFAFENISPFSPSLRGALLLLLLLQLLGMPLPLHAAPSAQPVEAELLLSATLPMPRGPPLPRLGVGTAGLGGMGASVVQEALQWGVRLVDTAQAPEWYSEAEVGRGIEAFLQDRSAAAEGYGELFLVTKVHPRSFAPHALHDMLLRSRRLLTRGSQPLDLVLLHSPFCWPGHCTAQEEQVPWQRGWRALEAEHAAGQLVSNIGVSNFDVTQLAELLHLADTKVAAVQNWCDPFHQDRAVRALAAENGVAYMAYSTLGTQWESKLGRNPVLTAPALMRIAAEHGDGTSVADVALSWALQEGLVAVPRSTSSEHIRRNSWSHLSPSPPGPPARPRRDELGRLRCFLSEKDMRDIRALDGTLGLPWD